MTTYLNHVNEKKTPQTQPIPGSTQVPNSAGGYSFAVDNWMRLDRFLILGAEGGSYYASEQKLTLENVDAVKRCLAADGPRTVARIVEISEAGRAPKNEPAILALAVACKKGDDKTRSLAYAAVPRVCRIGTHLMHFAAYIDGMKGWGRGARTAVGRWYAKRDAKGLAYQAVKYQSRDAWSNRDLLRLSHPKAPTPEHAAIFNWIVKGEGMGQEWPKGSPVELLWAFERAKTADEKETLRLITEYRLPRECVATQHLNSAKIWAALLPHMKPEAMVRNLAKMTACGLIGPLSEASALVVGKLSDGETLRAARLHPIKVLSAMLTYARGHGVRGSLSWTPDASILGALDAAFYKTFEFVEPANKRTLLALDISGSMGCGDIAGVPGLTPRVGSCAMALVTAATEKQHAFVAFTAGTSRRRGAFGYGYDNGISQLSVSPRQRLDDICNQTAALPMGGTDCALPMMWAMENKVAVDTFQIYTDSETWAGGDMHPVQALREYRQKTGIGAKLVVVGMVSNGFTIADPDDAGMLDVVGFDTAAPSVIADFSRV